jgi:hypothetical protein
LLVFADAEADAFADPKPNEGMLDMDGIDGIDMPPNPLGMDGIDMPPIPLGMDGMDMPPRPVTPVTSGTGIVPAT